MTQRPESSRTVVGALSRAAHLVRLLDAADLPGVDGAPAFPLPPKPSVTSCHGGQGFSVTPGRCDLNVDIRTTPTSPGAHRGHSRRRLAVLPPGRGRAACCDPLGG